MASVAKNFLREWAPLTDLFQKLPSKTQIGLFSYDLKITCIDVVDYYIVLGTNGGHVYWYDRKKKEMQRFRCENSNSSVVVVKAISTVDYMIACGTKDGNVSIFQMPKVPPESLPLSLRQKNNQVERYSVSELHKSSITALEWSKNGMKLFSGDASGSVVLTEFDFYMHLCKSMEILNESYTVVQLSYQQQNLLVSTTYRTILCQKQEKWKICQVGKKDRKVLGDFGGVFHQNSFKLGDVSVYCSRPGLRIWVSDLTGNVQQTLIFKDILNSELPEVAVLNPRSTNSKQDKSQIPGLFGKMLLFCKDLLVTYNNEIVYVLNPKDLKIIAVVRQLRAVLDVAISNDEIFILEGERSLLRIAFTPEILSENSPSKVDLDLQLVSEEEQTPMSPISNGEEATEHKKILKNNLESEQTYTDKIFETFKKLEVYNKISAEEYDDVILFKHGRRKKPDMTSSTSSLGSDSSGEMNITKPTVMTVSTVGILPDLRSPSSIQNDIQQKEKMLADILKFDSVKIDLKELDRKYDIQSEEKEVSDKTYPLGAINKKKDSEIHKKIVTNIKYADVKRKSRSNQNSSNSLSKHNNAKQNNDIENSSKVPEMNGKVDLENQSSSRINERVVPVYNLPKDWQVYKIETNEAEEEAQNSIDISLSEWEIV